MLGSTSLEEMLSVKMANYTILTGYEEARDGRMLPQYTSLRCPMHHRCWMQILRSGGDKNISWKINRNETILTS